MKVRGKRRSYRSGKPVYKKYRHTDELLPSFESRKEAIRRRLAEFALVPPDQYFYELVYCLLTPQSSAVNASQVVLKLQEASFLEKGDDATFVLNNRAHYIRFHNTKARHLQIARERFPVIAASLANGTASTEMREWLVHNVKGLGWKEASHFLRNIGHKDLAILDRHILKNLRRHGVLRKMPKSLTPSRYLKIESDFREFARTIGVTMDELDLLFWSNETGEILK